MSAADFFGELEDLRRRAIPDLALTRERRIGYRRHPIDHASPHAAEPMVEAAAVGIAGENHYWRADAPPYYLPAPGAIPELWLRTGMAERLARVDGRLRRRGLRVFLYDAWRPVAVQAFFHDVWMPAYVRRTRPGLDGDDLVREVSRYWAAPTRSPDSPAPHETGGAVDLAIMLERTGEPLPMGTLFDDMHPPAAVDFFENPANIRGAGDHEAAHNRRLLYWLMQEEGFAGHPDEWWHFSWGDQMWARLSNLPAAHYGLARPPAEPAMVNSAVSS